MCPHNRICAFLMTSCLTLEAILCPFEHAKHCPHIKYPHPLEKHIPLIPAKENAVVYASGSALSDNLSFAQYITDLKDGRRLYYINLDDIPTSGQLSVVDGEGKRITVDFGILA